MTATSPTRPHFRRPPIFEQAISLNFERVRDYAIVDPGLFFTEISGDFPVAETGPRFQVSTETFEGQPVYGTLAVAPDFQLPRAIFRNLESGELVQVQDDSLVFNWVRPNEEALYPRFERTSSRLWEMYGRWAAFLKRRHGVNLALRQCEMTNVNIIPVNDFGDDFDHMCRAFKVDPFAWNVEGLVPETYIRRRVHRMIDESGKSIGRLHSVITPVYDDAGDKKFQFELTARSAPAISDEGAARAFLERAHSMINSAFLASVTDQMRAFWGEEDGQ